MLAQHLRTKVMKCWSQSGLNGEEKHLSPLLAFEPLVVQPVSRSLYWHSYPPWLSGKTIFALFVYYPRQFVYSILGPKPHILIKPNYIVQYVVTTKFMVLWGLMLAAVQSCPRIHWFSIHGLQRPERNWKIKEIVHKFQNAPRENGP
jgi:hypothetical protein